MTLDEVQNSLPNGFHDAFLRGLTVDYVRCNAEIEIEVWTGNLNSNDNSVRESYRRGRLQLSGVLFLQVDTPNQEALTANANGISFDIMPHTEDDFPKPEWLAEPLPEGATFGSFVFTAALNSYLHVAFQGAEWVWQSDARTIY